MSRLPITDRYIGLDVVPLVKVLPNVPIIVSFCYIPKILPFHPSPKESVKVIVNTRVGGHPPTGQKFENIVAEVKVVPGFLW